MKKCGKIISMALIILLVMSMGMLSVAAESNNTTTSGKNDSITVTGAKPGETYRAYKLFDLAVDSETAPSAYSYTVNSAWTAFFADGGGAQYITVNEAGTVTAISDVAALAKTAAAWTGKPAAVQSIAVEAGEGTAVFSELEDGYWLITSTLGTVAFTATTPAASAVTIQEKNQESTIIVTEVKEDSTGNFGSVNDAQIGDTVEFKSIVKIVKGARNVVVHDSMDAGLTYTAGSVSIEGLTKGTEYSVNESPEHGDAFEIILLQDWIDELDFGADGYREYTITFAAVLNGNAVVTGDSGTALAVIRNTTYLTFGEGASSQALATTTETHRFSVDFHAKDSADPLAGAEFTLKKNGVTVPLVQIDNYNYRVAVAGETGTEVFATVADGNIAIWGVDADSDYSLLEIRAPAGHNTVEAVSVSVAPGNTTNVSIDSVSGTLLPGTGGIGTTVFYAVGGALVLVALILLITRKRMGR